MRRRSAGTRLADGRSSPWTVPRPRGTGSARRSANAWMQSREPAFLLRVHAPLPRWTPVVAAAFQRAAPALRDEPSRNGVEDEMSLHLAQAAGAEALLERVVDPIDELDGLRIREHGIDGHALRG